MGLDERVLGWVLVTAAAGLVACTRQGTDAPPRRSAPVASSVAPALSSAAPVPSVSAARGERPAARPVPKDLLASARLRVRTGTVPKMPRGERLTCGFVDSRFETGCGRECGNCGHCTQVKDGCRAVTREDCRCSRLCVFSGFCSPHKGKCAALTDEDCAESSACRTLGACHAVEGECQATKPEDCAYPCAVYGNCVLEAGIVCQPRSTEDCAKSLACIAYDRCVYRDKTCTQCTAGEPGCVLHDPDPDHWEADGHTAMSGAPPTPDPPPQGKGAWCGYFAWPKLSEK